MSDNIYLRDKKLIIECDGRKALLNWIDKDSEGYFGGVSFLDSDGHSIYNLSISEEGIKALSCKLYRSIK